MSFAVLHVTKFSGGGGGGIGAHIDRQHIPKNADPDRQDLNKELITPRSTSMKKDIDTRIQEGYTSTRKIRKDAVRAVGVILSGSHEQMKKIEAEGKINEWADKNLEFCQKRFGSDNIVRFTLHMDEKTPHIHAVFTPITEDGRLHFKSFIDGKRALTKLQDDYAKEMAEYGLIRGREHSRTKHQTTREYYAKIEDVEPIELKTNILGQPQKGEEERINEEFKKIQMLTEAERTKSRAILDDLRGQKDKVKDLTEEIKIEQNNAVKMRKSFLKAQDLLKKIVINKDTKVFVDVQKFFLQQEEKKQQPKTQEEKPQPQEEPKQRRSRGIGL